MITITCTTILDVHKKHNFIVYLHICTRRVKLAQPAVCQTKKEAGTNKQIQTYRFLQRRWGHNSLCFSYPDIFSFVQSVSIRNQNSDPVSKSKTKLFDNKPVSEFIAPPFVIVIYL